MKWIFLLVAIVVIPFVVSNDRDYNEEDDTEPSQLLVNKAENGYEINNDHEMFSPPNASFISHHRKDNDHEMFSPPNASFISHHRKDNDHQMFSPPNGSLISHRGKAKFLCGRRPAILQPRAGNINRPGEDEDEDYAVNRPIMGRIRGGRNQMYGEVPWHAVLIYQNPSGRLYRFCNGVIYNKMWIITSAHCASNFSYFKFTPEQPYVPNVYVFVGDHVTDKRDKGEQSFRIGNYIIRRDFKLNSPLNDVALLRLQSNEYGEYIQMNDYVQPICLTKHGEFLGYLKEVLISGFGVIYQGPYARSEWVKVMTAAPVYCKHPDLQSTLVFCLETTDGSTPCNGDSGGPVVTKVGDAWVLIGLIGFIDPDGCEPTRTPVYVTAMNQHASWVYFKVYLDRDYDSEIPTRS